MDSSAAPKKSFREKMPRKRRKMYKNFYLKTANKSKRIAVNVKDIVSCKACKKYFLKSYYLKHKKLCKARLSRARRSNSNDNRQSQKSTCSTPQPPEKWKKYFCIFCKEMITHFARHLETKHWNEPAVQEMLSHPKPSEGRYRALRRIRTQGTVIFTKNSTYNGGNPQRSGEFLPCPYCHNYFAKQGQRSHTKRCPFKQKSQKGMRKTPWTLPRPVHPKCNRIMARNIIPSLVEDDVSETIKNDTLLILFGNYLTRKHPSPTTVRKRYIQQYLRIAAKFLLMMKSQNPLITKFSSIYTPKYSNSIAKAVMKISGYDPETGSFKRRGMLRELARIIKSCGMVWSMECFKTKRFTDRQVVNKFLVKFAEIYKRDVLTKLNRSLVAPQAESREIRVPVKSGPLPQQMDYHRSSFGTNKPKLKVKMVESVQEKSNPQEIHRTSTTYSKNVKIAFVCYSRDMLNLKTKIEEKFDIPLWTELAKSVSTCIQLLNDKTFIEVIQYLLITDYQEREELDFSEDLSIYTSMIRPPGTIFKFRVEKTPIVLLLNTSICQALDTLIEKRAEAHTNALNPFLFGCSEDVNKYYGIRRCILEFPMEKMSCNETILAYRSEVIDVLIEKSRPGITRITLPIPEGKQEQEENARKVFGYSLRRMEELKRELEQAFSYEAWYELLTCLMTYILLLNNRSTEYPDRISVVRFAKLEELSNVEKKEQHTYHSVTMLCDFPQNYSKIQLENGQYLMVSDTFVQTADLLLAYREFAGVHVHNPFLFGCSGHGRDICLTSDDAIAHVAAKCGAKRLTYFKAVDKKQDIKLIEKHVYVECSDEEDDENSDRADIEVDVKPSDNRQPRKPTCPIPQPPEKWEKYFCIFCKEMITHFARHLETKHWNEPAVQEMLSHPKPSEGRNCALRRIRTQETAIFTKNSTCNNGNLQRSGEFLPCPHCHNYFAEQEHPGHTKCCPFKQKSQKGMRKTPWTLPRPVHPKCNRIMARNIIPSLVEDDVSETIKNDTLLILFGNYLARKHPSPTTVRKRYIQQYLRLAAKFLLMMKSQNPLITKFSSIYTPKYSNSTAKAVMKISGYDPETGSFKRREMLRELVLIIKRCGMVWSMECFKTKRFTDRQVVNKFLVKFAEIYKRDVLTKLNRSLVAPQAESGEIRVPVENGLPQQMDYYSSVCGTNKPKLNVKMVESVREKSNPQKVHRTSRTYSKNVKIAFVCYSKDMLYLKTKIEEKFDISLWTELAKSVSTCIQLLNDKTFIEVIQYLLITDYQKREELDFSEDLSIYTSMIRSPGTIFKLRVEKTPIVLLLNRSICQALDVLIEKRAEAHTNALNPFLFGCSEYVNKYYGIRRCILEFPMEKMSCNETILAYRSEVIDILIEKSRPGITRITLPIPEGKQEQEENARKVFGYSLRRMEELKRELEQAFSYEAWYELLTCLMTYILLLNNRSTEYPDRILVVHFANLEELSNVEKKEQHTYHSVTMLCDFPESYSKIQLENEQYLMVSDSFVHTADLLLAYREFAGVHVHNPFLFGCPGHGRDICLTSDDAIAHVAAKCGAKRLTYFKVVDKKRTKKFIEKHVYVECTDQEDADRGDVEVDMKSSVSIHQSQRTGWNDEEIALAIKNFQDYLTEGSLPDQTEYRQVVFENPPLWNKTTKQLKDWIMAQVRLSNQDDAEGKKSARVIGKRTRTRWTPEEIRIVKTHFHDHLRDKKLPSIVESRRVVRTYPVLYSRTPEQVRAWIQNRNYKSSAKELIN